MWVWNRKVFRATSLFGIRQSVDERIEWEQNVAPSQWLGFINPTGNVSDATNFVFSETAIYNFPVDWSEESSDSSNQELPRSSSPPPRIVTERSLGPYLLDEKVWGKSTASKKKKRKKKMPKISPTSWGYELVFGVILLPHPSKILQNQGWHSVHFSLQIMTPELRSLDLHFAKKSSGC